MSKVWAVEDSELGNLRKMDVEHLKANITTRVDTFRAPYGRTDLPHPRKCIQLGTTDRVRRQLSWPVRVN